MKQSANGFTIVELLIVIVVIGILAAIGIVAYSGMQNRAANAQIISIVKTYRTALDMYKAAGVGATAYPHAGTDYGQCLGKGYTYNGNHCWHGDGGTYIELASFNDQLTEYLPSPPAISSPKYYSIGGNNMRSGVVFFRGSYTVESGATNWRDRVPRIEYLLNGANQDCGLAGAVREFANWAGTGVTMCRVTLLPQP